MAFSAMPFVESLAQAGYVIVDNCLPEELVQGLYQACFEAWQNDGFSQAGVGADLQYQVRKQVRNNEVLWWQPDTLTPVQQAFCAILDSLKQELNRALFLGLQTYETHYAGYAPGSFYKKHEDSFRHRNNRRISMTFYLNRDWREADGGQLVLYLKHGEIVRVLPEWNRMVLFTSEGIPHEVLETHRTRFLIANWFKNREWPLV